MKILGVPIAGLMFIFRGDDRPETISIEVEGRWIDARVIRVRDTGYDVEFTLLNEKNGVAHPEKKTLHVTTEDMQRPLTYDELASRRTYN